ncbi:PLP-dependent transferase [Aspergillus sclerotioniger CBS 115572]|uniref:PLP-dependent transferase n=1 Tax=Aspergillus sclerotioniger CBS 115572 TaxID=1450535 RepID=A0A317WQF4_9EURO|nr:PLP-dependent transferase [Aspergillus sclerotioniger CBS 115572]PWY88636.1 PLP-dependent transferase [Aspergillus sclerotioniger CBS 115572]
MDAEEVDLSRGWPNPALLPTAALAEASATVMATPAIWTPALMYGPDEGYQPLREHIGRWLTAFYQPRDPITPERICITGGASQNLACILQVFTDPIYTRNVWMVAPTYHLACRIFDDSGFAGRLRAIPQGDAGLDLAYLRQELVAAEESAGKKHNSAPKYKPSRPWGKIYKHVIYATPTFSNPSTLTMSLSDRDQLVRLAREFDALIITDDVYDFLQWSPDPAKTLPQPDHAYLPRLVDVDRYLDGGPQDEWGNVVSNGSFSKLIGPGIRTGWAEATEKVAYGLSQTGSSRSGGAPSQLSAAVVAQLFPTGIIQGFIGGSLQPAYARRYYRMMSAIHEYLVPLGVGLPPAPEVAGGYFIWLRLPSPLRASDLASIAQRDQKLTVAPGNVFGVQRDPATGKNEFDDGLRLCFAWEEENKLEEGVRRLGLVIREVLK